MNISDDAKLKLLGYDSYIVLMERFTGEHSYPIGVFSTIEKAIMAGEEEELYRGGKYSACIVACVTDKYSQDLNYPLYIREEQK